MSENKCRPPNLDKGERWLPSQPQIIEHDPDSPTAPKVREVQFQSPAISLPHPQDHAEIVTVTWGDIENERRLDELRARLRRSPTQFTLQTQLDRLLIRLAGREPLSTLVAVALGLLLAASQSDVTDWRGWLQGAVVAVLGRMMNERTPNI